MRQDHPRVAIVGTGNIARVHARALAAVAAQFARVLAALAAGRRPPVGPAEARRTMALVAGIYASAFTGSPVTPGQLAPGTPFSGQMNGGNPAW